MSRATVEEFRHNAAMLLAAVERGEQFVIARGQKAVARLLPAEDEGVPDAEREELTRARRWQISRALTLPTNRTTTRLQSSSRIHTIGHERGSRWSLVAQASGWES